MAVIYSTGVMYFAIANLRRSHTFHGLFVLAIVDSDHRSAGVDDGVAGVGRMDNGETTLFVREIVDFDHGSAGVDDGAAGAGRMDNGETTMIGSSRARRGRVGVG
ncbi:hypothetical protein Salat_2442300 [Sesamum alatum]|uniref:Uncharacterized protein n=1 Tax=Sesamum alatum TaxID=300844 RepID=A0AAE1XYK5_9LAMI|nr:hypothetical protein Salat_2442300 [Sesamum alatum]